MHLYPLVYVQERVKLYGQADMNRISDFSYLLLKPIILVLIICLDLSLIGCSPSEKAEHQISAPQKPPPRETESKYKYGTDSYSSSADDELIYSTPVDRVIDQLRLGNIAFNTPQSMEIEKSQNVQLLLSLDQTIEELKSNIQALGNKEGASIKVSDRMEATLSGLAFNIANVTPNEQAIASKGVTSWQWEVIPKKEGRQQLYLTLTALLEVDGNDTKKSIKTFEKVIQVEVSPYQKASAFIVGNWQWLWATLVLPFGLWSWKKLKKQSPKFIS